ncbi:hypothetical protein F5148DRAFT_1007960 [Russula earlei]|uniref:Uncharacterized protein n=1 Tax=Russula earlei TaxID=71964 RepID=A0ACC0ULS0_9AGAM|nr:hypothetical protein F5148DRAFT_1007960 [Russula earlei]
MPRRSSTLSVSVPLPSSSTPLHSKPTPQLSPLSTFRTPASPWPPRNASLLATPRHPHVPGVEDPDELFKSLTILEVKQVHQRLLTDADAKQEELRLMVGERYRDLLQASSSIISIAQSSQDTLNALEDVKTSIPAEIPQLARRSIAGENDDTPLRILQSIAAHVKLLLDTPEHIWRLLEKKKYLHAGWLFLLARIIYQALVQGDAEDEVDWTSHGIDVLEQFPLVQRQWDTVSPLRAQITYKATLSLRDSNASLEDICSVLLTLHLLDSRPLLDVLSVFLVQRARSLQATLSRSPKTAPNGSSVSGSTLSKSRKVVVREVRECLEGVLEVIASTVGTARDVFRDRGLEDPSLMSRVLSFIQLDVPAQDTSLPSDLQMSTQHLLSTLPSASHFALLPATIRSYKPFVDLASATSSVSSAQLALRLSEWFSKAVTELRNVARVWFTELRTLKEVWVVRSWFDEWVGAKAVEDDERQGLSEVVDDVVHVQAVKILRTALGDLQDGFRDELENTLLQLRDGTSEALVESTPAKFLFQPVPPPSFDVGVGSSLVSAFRKYGSALQRQVIGRTPLLHKIVSCLEDGTKALQEDTEGRLTEKLREAYVSLAEECCKAILAAISSNLAELNSGTDADVRSLAFLSRLTEALHASPFFMRLKCETAIGIDYHGDISTLHEQAVNQWRVFVVKTVLAEYLKTSRHVQGPNDLPSQQSWSLMQALLSLSSYLHSVGAPSNPSITVTTLEYFTASLVSGLAASHQDSVEEQRDRRAKVWDLKFLRQLLTLWNTDWDGLLELDKLIKKLQDPSLLRTSQSSSGSDKSPNGEAALIEQHLLRTQILLAPLLPPAASQSPTHPNKSSTKDTRTESLLMFGVPAVEQTAQPVMDLAKPGPRFGSLLVGTAVHR